MKTRLNASLIVAALAAWLGAACADGSGEPAEIQQAVLACSGSSGATECQEASCDPMTREWMIDDLPYGTECSYSGHCDGQGSCVGQTLPHPPPTPDGFVIVARHVSSITLQWNPTSGTKYYHLYSPQGYSANLTKTSVTVGNLTPSTTYCFNVTASNDGGTSAPSPQICGRTLTGYVSLYPWGTIYDEPPYRAVMASMTARLESFQLSPLNDAALIGAYLVGPQGKVSDCGNSNRSFFLSRGQTSIPLQLYNIYGTARPALDIGLPVMACALFTDGNYRYEYVYLEAETSPASTIRVTSATYGGNAGAPAGNVTSYAASSCNYRVGCDYSVLGVYLGPDPAPGLAKDYKVDWTCSPGDGTVFHASAPAEAGNGSVVRLDCP